MVVPSLASILVTLVLLYLSTFILLAVVRVATGLSIQRFGYFSLRHVVYSPLDGVKIRVKSFGIAFHRPSVAHPTWVTLSIHNARITVDFEAIATKARESCETQQAQSSSRRPSGTSSFPPITSDVKQGNTNRGKTLTDNAPGAATKIWHKLNRLKNVLKRLHKHVDWIAMVDIHCLNATVHAVNAGEIHIGSFRMGVDTRRHTLQQRRLFRHRQDHLPGRRYAEWMFHVSRIFLQVEGSEALEIVDNGGLNIYGFLPEDKPGLKDISVSAKANRIHLPYDEFITLRDRIQTIRRENGAATGSSTPSPEEADSKIREEDAISETDTDLESVTEAEDAMPPSGGDANGNIDVDDAKAEFTSFLASALREVQEIQTALILVRFTRAFELSYLPEGKRKVMLNVVTHELGVDVHQIGEDNPAHRMYFQRNDIAHQALLAAMSLSVSFDDQLGKSERILYVPMTTTTIKTTLLSHILYNYDSPNAETRNSNILLANCAITSPAIDLWSNHLRMLLDLMQQSKAKSHPGSRGKRSTFRMMPSSLLPKATVQLSVQEPVFRFLVPTHDQKDYNLIFASISSVSFEVEALHSVEKHYSLSSTCRIVTLTVFYQNASDAKHRLLTIESFDTKQHLTATPLIAVVASGSLNTFTVHMLSGEVNDGIRQIIRQFNFSAQPTRPLHSDTSAKPSILRRLPPWLVHLQFEATGFSIEITGVDSKIGPTTRGLVLQMADWNVDYQSQKQAVTSRAREKRRTPSSSEDHIRLLSSSFRKQSGATDGRRLGVHVGGLEAVVIESAGYMEHTSFLVVPALQMTLTTSSDLHGPICHVDATIKSFFLEYSIYRLYGILVALDALREMFYYPFAQNHGTEDPSSTSACSNPSRVRPMTFKKKEVFTLDMKADLIEVKARMPSEPLLLLQVYTSTFGKYRWAPPYARAALIRLHAEAPKLEGAWARLVNISNFRFALSEREGLETIEEEHSVKKAIDVSTDYIRVAVPHLLVVHHIFDNFTNTTKAIQQLYHRFKTRENEYVAEKLPEGPMKVPRISLKSKALLFELEDDAFEWKLNNIYRQGLQEQKLRMAREEAFKLKLKLAETKPKAPPPRHAQTTHNLLSNMRYRRHNKPQRNERPARKRSMSADSVNLKQPSSSISENDPQQRKFDPERKFGFSESFQVSQEEAWYRLQVHNARSWKARIDTAYRSQSGPVSELRAVFANTDQPPTDLPDDASVLGIPDRPALFSAMINELHLVVDKPSFPIAKYPDFLYRIGKGMPVDMQYSLLIPMSFRLDMGESRANLRDYPLDFVHIPSLRPGQASRLPAWSLRTDFVIGEEFRDSSSSRLVTVQVVPPAKKGGDDDDDDRGHGDDTDDADDGFSVNVRRTVSSVKTYSDAVFEINTKLPTLISYGMSYQPVIQDMMKIFESFTKPEVDPSDRVGFWDKVRLCFHSKMKFVWKADGDVHLRLKGSRDPYEITGYGTGFVMCWRKDVQMGIHTSDDPKEFTTVTSGEYVLAVPDYSHEARLLSENNASMGAMLPEGSALPPQHGTKHHALFKKVVGKFSGNVRWMVGLVFERTLDDESRSWDFKPHYDVVLRNPDFVSQKELDSGYDAFSGFRSNRIHLSVAIAAPFDRVWSDRNREIPRSYNAVHLTPQLFTHFFNWWSLFSGVMALPVRQGSLFPGVTKSSKKFGRHLGTVKYNFSFAPVFLSHTYRHNQVAADSDDDWVCATGLKVRLDSFMLDLHQRREQINVAGTGRLKQAQSSQMRTNRAQLDLRAADLRALSAIRSKLNENFDQDFDSEESPSAQNFSSAAHMQNFQIPDQDYNWVDMDDFVEIDLSLPVQPLDFQTLILPLAFSPRFSYYRQTDSQDVAPGETGYSPFGNEPTHHCFMSPDDDPRKVQVELIKERLQSIDSQIASHEKMISQQQMRVTRESHAADGLHKQYELFLRQGEALHHRRSFLSNWLARIEKALRGEPFTPDELHHSGDGESHTLNDLELSDLADLSDEEFMSDFYNRFNIHNLQFKYNNSLRNIILRYMHQVSQRRGFVYYMSRRAVKFILDVVDEQSKSKIAPSSSSPTSSDDDNDLDDAASIEDRIEQILGDGRRFVNADEAPNNENDSSKYAQTKSQAQTRASSLECDELDDLSPDFMATKTYHLRLYAPQIQLQSDKNSKAVALVTAKSMQLKLVEIMDKKRVLDDINGLILTRYYSEMDGAQFFVATQKSLLNDIHMYSGNRYGNPPESTWPPWVAMESMLDFTLDPSGFSRIIQKTSASLQYNKFNTLRLKANESVSELAGEDSEESPQYYVPRRVDRISVSFPRVHAICDSTQYYAMYIIVLDLLMYSEPLQKTRNERLERIMLASDFSDLRGVPEMVEKLQHRILQLHELKTIFEIQPQTPNSQEPTEKDTLEKDFEQCSDELFFLMKAITTSQRKNEDRAASNISGVMIWSLAAKEIVWHLTTDEKEPLCEFQLSDAFYERTDNTDGSNYNVMEVQRIYGLNLLPSAIYPEMIAPYLDDRSNPAAENSLMFKLEWFMLEAIAGIPVLDNFEVQAFPMKLQLEHNMAKKLFEYVFPGVGANAFESGNFSPFEVNSSFPLEEEEEDGYRSDTSNHDDGGISNGPNGPSTTLQQRLKPTFTLAEANTQPPLRRPSTAFMPKDHTRQAQRPKSADESRHASRQTPGSNTSSKKASGDLLSIQDRFSTFSSNSSDDKKKFGLGKVLHNQKNKEVSDELTQMMTRASHYMILTHVKINDVVLCLSYKGKGGRNIQDVHNFVFRLPILEYRNKTWSNLDLALRLKKDVIKALISHTGAILSNKLLQHRPNKQQQVRLREMAFNSQLLHSSSTNVDTPSLYSEDQSSGSSSRPVTGRSNRSGLSGLSGQSEVSG